MNRRSARSAPRPPAGLLLQQVLRSVRHVGGDEDAILRRAGIGGLGEKAGRDGWMQLISHDQFVSIYRECVDLLERSDAKRSGRPAMGVSEFHMLCYCMISSATLGQAIDRAAAFGRLFEGGVGEFTLRTVRENAEFRMHSASRPRDAHMIFGVLTGLSSFARLFGWLVGKDLSPLTVKICYGPVLDEHVVSWLLPWRVEYEAEDNLLCFPARYLALPLVRSAAELDELLTTFPFDLATGRSSVTPASVWVGKICATALAHCSAPPNTEQIARQLGLSVATLKRRLSDENTSVRELKERCRCELAYDLLGDRSLTLREISLRLGFSDTTAFSRAFKAWTGRVPSAIRHESGLVGLNRRETR